MTQAKTKIIATVTKANSVGALSGLRVMPSDANYSGREFRFVKRLADAGAIVWVEWTKKFGAGWAMAENVEKFKGDAS